MNHRALRLGLSIGVVTVLALTAVALAKYLGGGGDALPPPPVNQHAALLIAADEYGAIVELGPRHVIGVARGMTRAEWDLAGENAVTPNVTCLERCPDAVLSGSLATLGQPDRPDPPVRWIVDGRTTTSVSGIPGKGVGKSAVFAARTRWIYAAQQQSLQGENRLIFADPYGSLHIALAAATQPTVVTNQDANAVVVLTQDADARGKAQWFERDAAGWRRIGSVTVEAESGCVADSGDTAVLLGDRATVIHLHQPAARVSTFDSEGAGSCTFSSVGPVLATNFIESGRNITKVQQFGIDGIQRWTKTFTGTGAASSSTNGPVVSISFTGEESRVMIVGPDGAMHRVDGAVSGMVTGNQLVTVDRTGRVTWTRTRGH